MSILTKPDVEVYREGNYSPTYVAVHEETHGGNGDVWVADGYGESYVHRFSKSGGYLNSIKGEEGAGRFNCPHGIFMDRRKLGTSTLRSGPDQPPGSGVSQGRPVQTVIR